MTAQNTADAAKNPHKQWIMRDIAMEFFTANSCAFRGATNYL
jgi:hypothetical protein